jgi:hypothetical protein
MPATAETAAEKQAACVALRVPESVLIPSAHAAQAIARFLAMAASVTMSTIHDRMPKGIISCPAITDAL